MGGRGLSREVSPGLSRGWPPRSRGTRGCAAAAPPLCPCPPAAHVHLAGVGEDTRAAAGCAQLRGPPRIPEPRPLPGCEYPARRPYAPRPLCGPNQATLLGLVGFQAPWTSATRTARIPKCPTTRHAIPLSMHTREQAGGGDWGPCSGPPSWALNPDAWTPDPAGWAPVNAP